MFLARTTTWLAAIGIVGAVGVSDTSPRGLGQNIVRQQIDATDAAPFAVADHRGIVGAPAPFAQYRLLQSALEEYRRLAARGGGFSAPRSSAIVSPGAVYRDAPLLAEWLSATGDLPSRVDWQPPLYDERLVEAVKRFQSRHGLTADGIIGPRTAAALRVSPQARARQIELAMERLRGLPDLSGRRHIVVNVPAFEAWAWDANDSDETPRLRMKVIVGRAAHNETPQFSAEMNEVVFRPSWNVPISIVRHEMLPLIQRNRAYLEHQHMEVLSGNHVVGQPANDSLIAKLSSGEWRLRQRPGPDNALGLVKFVFPNDQGIYMHGTPSPELFERPRRDFSHGCIRVEDPASFAEWALAGTDAWSRPRVEEAMHGTATVGVRLAAPVAVVIFYATAFVDPDDGRIHFADDVYGEDAALSRALGGARKAR